MNNAAAIILCAGKGTRMNDDSKNKVCFDCAGIPVIKRIIANMRKGGVSRFVIVIGHKAYSVMDCLDGEDGVVYAYQKEQKGTGHAALCGLRALSTVGYDGPAIISMGDKIVSPEVISGLLEHAAGTKAVWGVQPIEANYSGGRVIVADGKPYGVVEFADAALMSLADVDPSGYEDRLCEIGLNKKKFEKVIKAAKSSKPCGYKELCGRRFSVSEILSTPYANAGLYCFDVREAMTAISTIGSNNAQGEIYLTDALEYFARSDGARLYEVRERGDMLTYSNKPELRDIGFYFMRRASEFIEWIETGKADGAFSGIYHGEVGQQKERYVELLRLFIDKYGDQKAVITRAPGRINLMGRHIDHRGGGINVMATDKDTVFVASPREDDTVSLTNVCGGYPDRVFSIGSELERAPHENWLEYIENENVRKAVSENTGDWSNYIKAAALRTQLDSDIPLCGMNIAASGNIPVAVGLSSSSGMVVAAMEAVVSLNSLNVSDRQFVDLCGEGEWYVGSRGGAGDHAAMKFCKKDTVIHLGFKPFEIGETAEFSDKYAVMVVDSMIKSKKAEGSRDKFNAKVAAYEFAFMIIRKNYPEYDLREFRDLAKIRPYSRVYEILKILPDTITRGGVKALLPEYGESLTRIFATHADPGVYELRGVALYGISECLRAERFMDLLKEGEYSRIGEMMKISHDGDRAGAPSSVSDAELERLALVNADIAGQCGAYGCSLPQIDELCDLLNSTDGVLGSELVGAGLGGCVIALIEKEKSKSVVGAVKRDYFDKYGYGLSANIYSASGGSSVMF